MASALGIAPWVATVITYRTNRAVQVGTDRMHPAQDRFARAGIGGRLHRRSHRDSPVRVVVLGVGAETELGRVRAEIDRHRVVYVAELEARRQVADLDRCADRRVGGLDAAGDRGQRGGVVLARGVRDHRGPLVGADLPHHRRHRGGVLAAARVGVGRIGVRDVVVAPGQYRTEVALGAVDRDRLPVTDQRLAEQAGGECGDLADLEAVAAGTQIDVLRLHGVEVVHGVRAAVADPGSVGEQRRQRCGPPARRRRVRHRGRICGRYAMVVAQQRGQHCHCGDCHGYSSNRDPGASVAASLARAGHDEVRTRRRDTVRTLMDRLA